MQRPRVIRFPRTFDELTDSADLRSVVATVLETAPIDESALRRGVWTYVTTERDAGATPGAVIMALNTLIDEADVVTAAERPALTRRVILWCVEAYFGHLGEDVAQR